MITIELKTKADLKKMKYLIKNGLVNVETREHIDAYDRSSIKFGLEFLTTVETVWGDL